MAFKNLGHQATEGATTRSDSVQNSRTFLFPFRGFS